MKQIKVFLVLLLAYVPVLFAQQPAPVADSTLVKTLFFAGLKDKLNEDFSKANESFSKILLLDPNNAAVYYEISSLNYRQNKLVEAEQAIKKAVALESKNIWYWMMLAELQKRKGDMDGMAAALNDLISLAPEKEGYYFDRSNAYLLSGKTDLAKKGYDEIEQKFGASESLTKARKRLVTGGKESKLEVSPVADQTDEQAMLFNAEKLYKEGNLDAALLQLKQILKNTEQIYMVWERIIEVQLRLKQYKEAIKTAEEALSIYPNQAILYYFMALSLQYDLQYDQAIKYVKSALELDVDNGACLELYGDVLFLKGQKDLALVQWKKSKALGNGSEKLNRKINEQKYVE